MKVQKGDSRIIDSTLNRNHEKLSQEIFNRKLISNSIKHDDTNKYMQKNNDVIKYFYTIIQKGLDTKVQSVQKYLSPSQIVIHIILKLISRYLNKEVFLSISKILYNTKCSFCDFHF